MKATGIVRQIDDLGRVVLPKELRRSMNIKSGDGFEIFVDNDQIILSPYRPLCIFCGDGEGLKSFTGKQVCRNCRRSLSLSED